MPTFSVKELTDICVKLIKETGADEESSNTVANNLIKANLAGHDSHGVIYLPRLLERMLGLLIPQEVNAEEGPEAEPPSRRIMEAMTPENDQDKNTEKEEEPELEIESTLTASANELLQKMDFEEFKSLGKLENWKTGKVRSNQPYSKVILHKTPIVYPF